jgi:hypothetical protein
MPRIAHTPSTSAPALTTRSWSGLRKTESGGRGERMTSMTARTRTYGGRSNMTSNATAYSNGSSLEATR